MRVILDKSLEEEIPARITYYQETYGVYMSLGRWNNEILLQSMPLTYAEDILIIVGHNRWANSFIEKRISELRESKIVLVTCQRNYHFERFTKYNKRIYIARQKNGFAHLRCRTNFRFDFDPTDSEIISYRLNKKYSVWENIEKSYVELKQG